MNRLDHGLHLLMAEHHGTQHDVFGKLLRLRFDHQNGLLRAGHNKIELRRLELGGHRVQDILPVQVANSRGANRATERNSRERERRGSADHGRNVRIDFLVRREHRRNNLHLVVETFGK